MRRIELPSGGWAEFRDPKTIANRVRRPIERVTFDLREHDSYDLRAQLTDLLIQAFVVRWSFPMEIPADNPDSIGSLTGPDYDALGYAALKTRDGMFLDTETIDTDPKAPSTSSDGSGFSPQAALAVSASESPTSPNSAPTTSSV